MKTSTNLKGRGKGVTASWACGFMLVVSFLLTGTIQAQTWSQRGSDLKGTVLGDQFGEVVCVSADGNTMAIGIPALGLNSTQEIEGIKGSVQILTWNGKTWQTKGDIIFGPTNEDGFGLAVALSADGNVVFIGAPFYDNENGRDVGWARVYEFSNSRWNPVGNPFVGYMQEQMVGAAVAMNDGGDVVALGAPAADLTPESYGQVWVYKRTPLRALIASRTDDAAFKSAPTFTNQWQQVGNILYGNATRDRFGWCVDLSSNGKVLAVGSPANNNAGHNAGMVTVYVLRNNQWLSMGAPIYGNLTGEQTGRMFDLSNDGSTIAIGAAHYSGLYYHGGKVMVYYYNSENWVVKGDVFFGRSTFDYFGYAVNLNYNGSVLAVGAPFIHPYNVIPDEIIPGGGLVQYKSDDDMPDVNKSTAYVQAYEWVSHAGGITSQANKKSLGANSTLEGYWSNLGDPIFPEIYDDYFGNSIALASNSPVMAIGASQTKSAENPAMGYVQVYKLTSNDDVGGWETDGRYSIRGDVISTLPTPLMEVAYPNPTNGELTIQFVGYIEDVTLSVYHASGNLVLQQHVEAANRVELYIPGKPGVYILELLLPTGDREQMQVVKQ